MTDMRIAMRNVSNTQRARQILSLMAKRISDIEFIGWPLLEQSLKAELAELTAIARERGLIR